MTPGPLEPALNPRSDAHARVDLAALAGNARALAGLAGVPLIAPVKADAYGHGAELASRALDAVDGLLAGLAVATAGEALQLAPLGLRAPLLLLTPSAPENLEALVRAGVQLTVSSEAQLDAVEGAAGRAGRPALVQVKVNTGLNRLGACPDEAARLLARLSGPGGRARLVGVFTHFIDSEDARPEFAGRQLELFADFVRRHRPGVPFLHVANTGGVLNPALREGARELGVTAVRPGIGVYGYLPGEEMAGPAREAGLNLRPAMTLVTRVTFVKRVAAGEVASYNAAWRAVKPTWLATLRLGYADGYPRALSGKASVVWRGRARPLAGRVCMDQVIVDTGDEPAEPEEEVVVFGPGPVTAETLAELAGTNSYEILTGVGARVPRVPA
ncbi:MAG TPA: alanine racemase [Deinococcales bacterium]|nr:alanine racemase [Deinococcales bacterium]